MQEKGVFSIIRKDTQQKQGSLVSRNHEVSFLLQKEGYPSTKHSAIIGCNQLNPSLEEIILQMSPGDRWTIADSAANNYSIEVLGVGREADCRSPCQKAEDLKLKGNQLIKAKKYKQAASLYKEAYYLIRNDLQSTSQEVKLSIASNLALALLNCGEFEAAVQWCNIHMEESGEPNLKVIYRRASAHKGLRRWDAARQDIQLGIQHCQGDEESTKNFKQLLATTEKEEKEQKLRDKAFYGKMLG